MQYPPPPPPPPPSPFLQKSTKSSFSTEGEHIKKDKGKKVMSSKETKKESTNSNFDDDETYLIGSMVESFKIKKVKKFDFVTEGGKNIHLTEEEINHQKKIEEDAKAEVAKHEMADLLSLEVGPITLKVYREDSTSKVIPNFKANDLHLGEWIEDPCHKLNDLANKKRKHADDIHDYFKANKRLKSSVPYEDNLVGTVLNEPILGMIMFNSYHRHDFVTIEDLRDFSNTMLYTIQEIFFRRHQGLRLTDYARTFSAILLAKIDKRNLNPLKQMRTIEQLRK
ncbi:hypothetical protein Tco_0688835 [Tanacetum coccineum]